MISKNKLRKRLSQRQSNLESRRRGHQALTRIYKTSLVGAEQVETPLVASAECFSQYSPKIYF